MIKLGLLLTNQYRLLSVAAILDVFETVNRIYRTEGKEDPFLISVLCGSQHPLRAEEGCFHGYTLKCIHSGIEQDIVLVPSFHSDDVKHSLQQNYENISWLGDQYRKGAEIASFCTGAFLLGAAGLLDGKIATTHVDACTDFAAAFPQVKLLAEKTVTQDGRLYTSGGATSSFHLMLHLLQVHCSREISVKVAKYYSIDMDRNTQSYFSTFQVNQKHDDQLVAMAQRKIELGYQHIGTIEEMIRDIPASRRNILRRFKQVTGVTPIEYLQHIRIAAARKLLEQTSEQMTAVIYLSGYNDAKAFRRIFRKTVGMTPSAYREKFYAG